MLERYYLCTIIQPIVEAIVGKNLTRFVFVVLCGISRATTIIIMLTWLSIGADFDNWSWFSTSQAACAQS